MFDDDENGKKELIGEIITTLGAIVGSKEFLFTAQLTNPKNAADKKCGEITIKVQPIKESKTELEIKLGCRNLPIASSCFCMSGSIRPFIRISRSI